MYLNKIENMRIHDIFIFHNKNKKELVIFMDIL